MAAVARVYAKALFELAQEAHSAEKILEELTEFNDLIRRTPALTIIFGDGACDPAARKSIASDLAAASKFSDLMSRFIKLLVAKNRAAIFSDVLSEYNYLFEASRGVLTGQIYSAVELSPEELQVLTGAITKRVGSKVQLDAHVDPTLLGGVLATVGGKTFDASLRTQLERFRNELI